MQQTTQYKLNKPDLDDSIAIAPLNENADKIEAAILAETAARQSADATETSARQSAIAAEAQARAEADAAEIQARQSAIASEAQARQSAIASEAATRQSALNTKMNTAQAEAAHAALSGRIQALEAHKFVVGTYTGNGTKIGEAQFINLGFTPIAVILTSVSRSKEVIAFCTQAHPLPNLLQIVSGGFNAIRTSVYEDVDESANHPNRLYFYLAFC